MRAAGEDARIRVILVEDHPLIARGFAELMRGDAISVVGTYASVSQAPLDSEAIDVVVLDLRLNDGSSPALNVAAAVRRGLKVLIYSEADDPGAVRGALAAGASGLVRKQESAEALIAAIRDVHEGRTAMSFDLAAALEGDRAFTDAHLTEREKQVLGLYATGATAAEVAHVLGIASRTVAVYVQRIRQKYTEVGRNARTRTDLYLRAQEDRLAEGNGA